MKTEIAKKSAIEALANRLEVSKDTMIKTLQSTAFLCCKTNEEFVSAVIVANTYKLNPILGEIYAFPTKGGGVKPIVPIDGWISLVNRNPDHDGVEIVENRSKDGKLNISKTDVDSVTVKFYMKGKTHPIIVTEYMIECYDGSKQPWQKWPIRMLRHKAYIQGARVAYGFSGIYDPDEGDRIDSVSSSVLPDREPIEMPQPKQAEVEKAPKVELVSVEAGLSDEEKAQIENADIAAANEQLKERKRKAKENA